ncbi:MAG: hypothetical protein LBD94_00880 [Rickettsiales bacterium]|jgi:hypothetical protein|nr:hypothetical protein [Rickettsiales bacterium]
MSRARGRDGKKLKKLKKFLLPLLLYIPFGAKAAVPIIAIALIAAGVAIAGFSIYRSFVPVNLSGALEFFSSCWSCRMFSGIIENFSIFIPKLYDAIGENIIPIAAGMTLVWFAWTLLSDYIKITSETNAWKITGDFGTHIIKLTFVVALLAFPLPRFIMNTFIEPVMNVGLSYNRIARNYIQPDDTSFETCIVATALQDSSGLETQAYSPKLRHNILCQIAEFHRITGLGMTVGWTFLQMAFSYDYMHKVALVPLFPNVILIFSGALILLMFLWALFPVPIYFFEVFLKLTLDLLMLPLFLLGWLFNKWNIFPNGGAKGVKEIVDEVVKNTCGIALVGLFAGFAILFLNGVIGAANGIDGLITALKDNNSDYLMESLMFNNDSLIVVILAGIFIGMFMNAVPVLVKKLFNNVEIPEAEKLQTAISTILKNTYKGIKGKVKALMKETKPSGEK